jgi:hypothetical protein
VKIFAFDPADYRDRYAEQGWIHIRNGIDPEFFAVLRGFAEERFGSHKVEGKSIGGRKDQALYEFPGETDFPGELFDSVAAVAGLNRPTMTLSERHIKAYDHDAPDEPLPHKDRFASQVSVGLSIDIPSESRLVLYPHDDVHPNPYNVSAALLQRLAPSQRPEVTLKDAREVVIDDQGGDVMMFPGSATWHKRRKPARAVNLYLKFNDFNSDPLGEDPSTEERGRRTLAALAGADGNADGLVPTLGRRLDTVTRDYIRSGQEVLHANVWEREPILLSDRQWRIIQAVDGRSSLEAVLARAGADGDGDARSELRLLAEQGVIELV